MSSQVIVERPLGALEALSGSLSRLGPVRQFWAILALHVVLWTVVPSLVLGNAPLDVIEGLAWGRAWELGYHKHPPLFAWLSEATMRLSGDRIWSIYLLSQLCVGITFYSVWRLGLRVLGDPRHALIAVLLLDGVYYYGVPTPEFNPLILQMAFWASIVWLFHRAMIENRSVDWFIVGALAGLDILTRYSSGVLLASLGLFLLLHPRARHLLRGPGPYLALATTIAVAMPHLVWLVGADFPTFGYVLERAPKLEGGLLAHLLPSLKFLGAQLAALASAALLLIVLIWPWRTGDSVEGAGTIVKSSTFDRAYLAAVSIGPVFIAVLASSLLDVGLRSMWGAQMWAFIGLFALAWWLPILRPAGLRRFAGFWALTALTTLAVFAVIHVVQPVFSERKKRTTFPGRDLARIVTDRWHAEVSTPLHFVVGKVWVAGNVSVYSPDRPAVFIDGDEKLSPWIQAEQIKKYGAVLLWVRRGRDARNPWMRSEWSARFNDAVIQTPIQLPWNRLYRDKRPLEIGWAILYPEDRVEGRNIASAHGRSGWGDQIYLP
jgi:hypothetical protein